MTDPVTPHGVPPAAASSRELLRLARSIERSSVQRRKLLAKVAELEQTIRAAKRLFRLVADSIGVEIPSDGADHGAELP